MLFIRKAFLPAIYNITNFANQYTKNTRIIFWASEAKGLQTAFLLIMNIFELVEIPKIRQKKKKTRAHIHQRANNYDS